jgi:23S rRNA (uridine2552-2'-O)-methyltransferase
MVKQADLKRDIYYKRTKLEGYRSRSAFKLLQISNKFGIIRHNDLVVDLGAAPGGWSQVAKVLVGDNGLVISVDLQPMEKIADVVILKSDITKEQETLEAITEVLRLKGKELVDAVISDASPQLSGNRDYDQFRSFELSTSALNIASALLKHDGNFVAKIFQGAYYNQFYMRVKEKFRYARAYSPAASRKKSAEVYMVGKGYAFRPMN